MTDTSPRSHSRQQPRAQTAQIHIPHSSWSRIDRAKGSGATLAPDDFWSRLGL